MVGYGGGSSVRYAAVFLHEFHEGDKGVVAHVEAQLLVEHQVALLHALHSHALQLQPSRSLLGVVERVEVQPGNAALWLVLLLAEEEVHADALLAALNLSADVVDCLLYHLEHRDSSVHVSDLAPHSDQHRPQQHPALLLQVRVVHQRQPEVHLLELHRLSRSPSLALHPHPLRPYARSWFLQVKVTVGALFLNFPQLTQLAFQLFDPSLQSRCPFPQSFGLLWLESALGLVDGSSSGQRQGRWVTLIKGQSLDGRE